MIHNRAYGYVLLGNKKDRTFFLFCERKFGLMSNLYSVFSFVGSSPSGQVSDEIGLIFKEFFDKFVQSWVRVLAGLNFGENCALKNRSETKG